MRRQLTSVAVLIIVTVLFAPLQAELEIRAASSNMVVGWPQMDGPGNRPIWVSPTVSLTDADISTARAITDQDGRRSVAILLTDGGAVKMRALSVSQIGKPIALILDGTLIWAPVVRDPIGNQAVVTGGPNGLTAAQVERILIAVPRR